MHNDSEHLQYPYKKTSIVFPPFSKGGAGGIFESATYKPPQKSLWIGREDTPNGRLFQRIQMLDCTNLPEKLPKNSIVLLGFASDEGVRRNLGRVGASQGPDSLRKALRNIPLSPEDTRAIFDAGDIGCIERDLESAQIFLGQTVKILREHGAFVIVLGGGHEVAFGHFQGLIQPAGIDVINFDAHFDLRPLLPEQKGSSGTGFRQMHDFCQNKHLAFRYLCLGVQPFGNSHALFDYAKSTHTHYFVAETMATEVQDTREAISEWLETAKSIYLTLCLDVFSASAAPGVSAPQALGLLPQTVLPFFKQILASGKVIGFDVAELNPLIDRDDQTAALGAYFIAEVLRGIHVG